MGGMSAGKSTPALSWESVSYSVASGNKLILDNCTGAIYSGQVCAVLGPSGSGKTTLLDVIAGRVEKNRKGRSLSGDINMAPGTRMRYVQQEDSLCGILSVRETLTLATRLAGAPLSRAEDLLQELGLTVCQDTNVGTIFFKGISGGQKRRLSIAVELVSNPTLLLLDEPTSGGDTFLSFTVHIENQYLVACKGVLDKTFTSIIDRCSNWLLALLFRFWQDWTRRRLCK